MSKTPKKDEMQILRDEVQKPQDRMQFLKDEKFTAIAKEITYCKFIFTN